VLGGVQVLGITTNGLVFTGLIGLSIWAFFLVFFLLLWFKILPDYFASKNERPDWLQARSEGVGRAMTGAASDEGAASDVWFGCAMRGAASDWLQTRNEQVAGMFGWGRMGGVASDRYAG
jgi:hypothetical protein